MRVCGTAWQAARRLPRSHLRECLKAGITWHVTGWSAMQTDDTSDALRQCRLSRWDSLWTRFFSPENSTSVESLISHHRVFRTAIALHISSVYCNRSLQSLSVSSANDEVITCRCRGRCVNKDTHPDIYSSPYQQSVFAWVYLTLAHTLLIVAVLFLSCRS